MFQTNVFAFNIAKIVERFHRHAQINQSPNRIPVVGVVYDRATHALIRDTSRSGRSSQSPGLQTNADGSVDIWFGPQAPEGGREIMRRLTPRTLFLMPTVSIISGTTGWFLAVQFGYSTLEWPAYGWVAAALILVASIQEPQALDCH
jgi:hypothetical protein